MNLKALMIIFVMISSTIAGGCAEKLLTQNSGPDQKMSYGLVPPYFNLLSSPDNIKPEQPDAHPVLWDEREEFNKILSEAALISQKLNSTILSYEEEGKDVQKLKSLLEEYNALIVSAKTYQELADQGHEDCTGPECQAIEKELYLHLSRENLKRSNAVLSDIFNEMKMMLPGHVRLGEGCTLSGKGAGRVLFAGDLSANLSIRNGILYIIGLPDSSGSPLSILGKYEFEKSEKPQDRVSYYQIFDATVDISAQRSAFIVEANEISLNVKGNGTVDFFGNGTYTITCPDGSSDGMKWEVPAVRRTINSPSVYTGIK